MTTKIDESDSTDQSQSLTETTKDKSINQVLQRTPSTLTSVTFGNEKNTDDIIEPNFSDELYKNVSDEEISSI